MYARECMKSGQRIIHSIPDDRDLVLSCGRDYQPCRYHLATAIDDTVVTAPWESRYSSVGIPVQLRGNPDGIRYKGLNSGRRAAFFPLMLFPNAAPDTLPSLSRLLTIPVVAVVPDLREDTSAHRTGY